MFTGFECILFVGLAWGSGVRNCVICASDYSDELSALDEAALLSSS